MGKLTAKMVGQITEAGRYGDGNGPVSGGDAQSERKVLDSAMSSLTASGLTGGWAAFPSRVPNTSTAQRDR